MESREEFCSGSGRDEVCWEVVGSETADSNNSMMQEKRMPLGRQGQTGSSAQVQGQHFIHENRRKGGEYHIDTDSPGRKDMQLGKFCPGRFHFPSEVIL